MDTSRPWRTGDASGLHFLRYDVTDTGSPANVLGHLTHRTGIYWLRFDDGTEYVGQAVDVVARLATHYRHQQGHVIEVSFVQVAREDLDEAERWLILQRDAEGAALRNKLITLRPGGPGPGSYLEEPGIAVALPWERERRGLIPPGWVAETATATPHQVTRWDRLQSHDAWPQVRTFLRAFLRETMSSPHLTAGRRWTISAMPNTSPLPGWHRLCTLNVGRIEAIYIGEDAEEGLLVNWNMALPDPRSGNAHRISARDLRRRPGVWAETEHYAEPVLAVQTRGARRATDLLTLPGVADLSYAFNTRYQRQGMALQRRWHNPLLAAELLTGA